MSLEHHTSDSSARSPIDRFGFSHLLGATVVLTAATILLGVAAKATGAGLACDANWPLCDGGLLNLFPANFPSFFEWIHRVVAMVAGFFIIGTAIVAWRSASVGRWVTYAITAGMILTPIQVYLGRETVLVYDLTILNFHFWTAVVIFVLFVGSAVAVWAPGLTTTHVAGALGLGAAMIPIHVTLSPLFIGTYTPVIQTLQYAATLVLLSAAILAVMIAPRRVDGPAVTGLVGVTAVLTFFTILFGRHAVMTYLPALDLGYLLTAALLFVVMIVGAVTVRRRSGTTRGKRALS